MAFDFYTMSKLPFILLMYVKKTGKIHTAQQRLYRYTISSPPGELKIIQITLKVFRNFADINLIVIFVFWLEVGGWGAALIYGKTGVYTGIHYFSYFFALKHRLWDSLEPLIYIPTIEQN